MKSLIPILLIVVAVGLFFVYINPTYQNVQDLSAQNAQYGQAVTKANELIATKNELLTKYNNLPADQVAELVKLLPDQLNTAKLVADMDSIAGKYGIAIGGIRVSQAQVDAAQSIASSTEAVKPYQTTTVTFQFSATYENLVKFLSDLEKSLQIIDVKSIVFQAVDTSAKSAGLYNYVVSFDTYWLK